MADSTSAVQPEESGRESPPAESDGSSIHSHEEYDRYATIYDMPSPPPPPPTMSNTGHSPLLVPGFGPLPYHHEHHFSQRFAHGFNDWRQIPCATARELAMTNIMNAITDKPGWHAGVFDSAVVEQWRAEMAGRCKLFSPRAWEWCLAELRDKVGVFEETGLVRVLDTGSCVWKSDGRVSAGLEEEIRTCSGVLRAEMGEEKKPGQRVLNLVGPSLYPLVYGRTHVLSDGGRVGLDIHGGSYGSGIPAPLYPTNAPTPAELEKIGRGELRPFAGRSKKSLGILRWSSRFQWLPCEVEFASDEGNDVKITSYINNLSPIHHKPFYTAIEKLISLAIEPWNKSLIKGRTGPVPIRLRTYGAVYTSDQYQARYGGPSKPPNPQHPEPGTAFSYADWKAGRTGKAIIDMDEEFRARYSVPRDYTHDMYEANLRSSFRHKGLQVIVKITSLELTPAHPSIPAGEWKLDGTLNDHIVASALYVYDSANVTPAPISFRQEMWSHPESYHCYSNDSAAYAAVFGLDASQYASGPSMQRLGGVALPGGRFVAWPNTMQHRFEAVGLVDGSKPGHRRFVTLMLVDPHYRVCSTRNVAPQRQDWWEEGARGGVGMGGRGVPREVEDLVMGYTEEEGGRMMGRGEAEGGRREVLEEVGWVNRVVEGRAWKIHGCYCVAEGYD